MAKTSSKSKIPSEGERQYLPMNRLHLDHTNPRFGGKHLTSADETKVLDEIVGQHGIVDVISSMAANGYFDSEPLVGAINKAHKGDVTIVEGNRRLCAALILAGNPRGKKYAKLRSQYPKSKIKVDTQLPVLVYDWKQKKHRDILLPYLGVRHIVGAQQWDSFAKAAWVADAVESQELSLDNIKQMIGDDQGFTDRLVEGYYFVLQLRDTNAYDAANSLRRGRGSMQDFPFSWVYTALGYKNVREYLGLPRETLLERDPIADDYLENAGLLMQFMFGGAGRNAAIDDSRKIGTLAKALGSKDAVAVLEEGGLISDALDASRPPEKLLLDLFGRADKSLGDAVRVASGLPRLEAEVYVQVDQELEKVSDRVDSLITVIDGLQPQRKKRRERK